MASPRRAVADRIERLDERPGRQTEFVEERALRVVFDLLDYNRDGTLERKDIIYSCMDGGRMGTIHPRVAIESRRYLRGSAQPEDIFACHPKSNISTYLHLSIGVSNSQ